MNANQYINMPSSRPVFAGIAMLALLGTLTALVVLVLVFFNSVEEWDGSGVIGQWAGVLVAIVGFMVVLIQLRRETSEIQNQTKWQVYSNGLTTLNVFVDYPELRPYFYDDNVALPDDPTKRNRIFAAAEMLADHWESTILSDSSLNIYVNDLWETYMRGIYCKSPALREFLEDKNEGYRYSAAFKDLLKQSFSEKTQMSRAEGAQ